MRLTCLVLVVIKRIGDVLLEAATEFRTCYPRYVAALPWAEKRVKEECESNHDLRLLLDVRPLLSSPLLCCY